MNSDFIPPWEREDAFPEKPAGDDYGYILRGKFIRCSRDELMEKCSSTGLPHIQLVWCPEWPRVAPATQFDFLFDALRKRKRSELKSAVGIGSLNLLIWGVLGLPTGHHDGLFIWTWVLLLATTTGVIPVVSGIYGLKKLKRSSTTGTDESLAVGRYSAWVLSRRILFTWLLLGGIGGVFLVECIHGFPESAKAAGLDKHAVWHGEWWRLFTGPLLHGNLMHFIFNASALVGLGRLMEVLTSRYHLALVFGVSALTGSIFSLFLLPATTSVGASGGLLGLIGFLAMLGCRRKQMLPPGFARSLAVNVAIIAAMGILAFSIIDNAAHLGGFLAGIALGFYLVNSTEQGLPLMVGTKTKAVGILAFMVTLSFAAFGIFRICSNPLLQH
ncbi:MAG: rhomboid family intramembrane serine protease [Verrucomicrobiae bacterium]|nr:rhomboid family intramembrane serine protease [Verrucomicrobiae bacterium]